MFEAVVKEINNGLDMLPKKLDIEEIGKMVGTSRQTVSDMLKTDRECTKFMHYLKSVKVVSKSDHVEPFKKLAVLFRKTNNVKIALEFLAANNANSSLKSYINDLKEENIDSVTPFLNIYELMGEYQETKVADESFLTKINSLKETNANLRFLKQMLKSYYYVDNRDVTRIKESLSKAEKELGKVKDVELKSIYEIRVLEMKATIALFLDTNFQEARKANERILNETDFFGAVYQANAYYKMGMSYFFESPDICIHNLKKAAKLYRNSGNEDRAKDIENNELNMAAVMWNKVESIEEVKGTPSEAHYLVKIGMEEKALEVIETLNENSPFTKFYKGLAMNEPFLLLESLKMLCDKGMNFYAKLPEIALENFPEASNLVKLINRGAGNQ